MTSKSSEAQGRGEKMWRMTECWMPLKFGSSLAKKVHPKPVTVERIACGARDVCVSANAFIQDKTLYLVWSEEPLMMKLTDASCSNVKICLCVLDISFLLANTFWHNAGSCSELGDAGQEPAGGHVSDFTCAGSETLFTWVVHWVGLCVIQLCDCKVMHLH